MGEKFPANVDNPLLTQVSGVGPLHCHVVGQSVSSLVFVMQCTLKLLEHLKVMGDIGGFPRRRNSATVHPESKKTLLLVL